MDQKLKLQNLCCPRCGCKTKFSKWQSDVKKGKIVRYCFNQEHVYKPVKIVTVNEFIPLSDFDVFDNIVEGYNLKKLRCILCGDKITFKAHESCQMDSKIVGNCTREDHRIKFTIASKIVDEPDCKELIQIKIHQISDIEKTEINFRVIISSFEKMENLKFTRLKNNNDYLVRTKKMRKYIVLYHYSDGVIQCRCCGEMMWEFLTIDHITGKKSVNHDNTMVGDKLYLWLIRNSFPSGFQVLCFNCNIAKRSDAQCPHQLNKNRGRITLDGLMK